MDDTSRTPSVGPHPVEIEIPDAQMFEYDTPTIEVPAETVMATIDILAACIAQWRVEVGCVPDDEVWSRLMGAAGLALGKLAQVYAIHRAAGAAEDHRQWQEYTARNRAINKQWEERRQQERSQQAAAAEQPAADQDEKSDEGAEAPPLARTEPERGWEF